MYTLYRLLRNLIRSIASQAAPWQIGLGTFLGTLIGFLPIWPLSQGPSPLGLALVITALVVNCHLGSVLLFWGLCKGLALTLGGPAVMLGDRCMDLAQRSADVSFLYLSHWSHTGYLGLTLLGFAFAPLFAILMVWVTVTVRTKLIAKVMERQRLMTAGKVANQAWAVRAACWFFGL